MKKFAVIIGTVFALSACQVSYDAASTYDDVYYTPKATTQVEEIVAPSSGITYGSNTSANYYEQSSVPESEPMPVDETSSYKSSDNSQEYYPESDSDEYYYQENGDDNYYYYDYDYATRINRFYRANVGFGYYDPFYTGFYYDPWYYQSGFSFGFGWGWPYSNFSLSL
ncbi:MAG TPA: hypothetical protein P5104_04785, partial [Bacteroidales bacterium]|nr:hypothetical protein [Bacteroidales bacterium]